MMLKHFHDRDTALAFEDNAKDREDTLSALNELEATTHRTQP
jgi:hypothetical protein